MAHPGTAMICQLGETADRDRVGKGPLHTRCNAVGCGGVSADKPDQFRRSDNGQGPSRVFAASVYMKN